MQNVFASMCISVLRLLNHFTSNHCNKVTTALLVELCFDGPIPLTVSFILQNQLPRGVGQLSVLGTSKSCWWLECPSLLLCLFGVSCCHCLFCAMFRHSFIAAIPVRSYKVGEFSSSCLRLLFFLGISLLISV